jgi:hypothetical protein
MSARSFVLGKRRQGNITVEESSGSRQVYLHGNKIVDHDLTKDEITISDCGWQTVTTKTALNRYFDNIGLRAYVYQRDFVWYLNLNRGDQVINLGDHGNRFTFYPNSFEVANVEINKRLHSGRILDSNENSLTVR